MICNRCGAREDSLRAEKRRARGLELLCKDCCATVAKTVMGPLGKCVPHHGEFDLMDNPMEDGELYLPGKRRCGRSDCIARSHIEEL